MGITVTITTMRTANGIRMELRSDNKSGTIIGRRGETLIPSSIWHRSW